MNTKTSMKFLDYLAFAVMLSVLVLRMAYPDAPYDVSLSYLR